MLREINKEFTRAKDEANLSEGTVYGALCSGRALAYADCKVMLESVISKICDAQADIATFEKTDVTNAIYKTYDYVLEIIK